MRFVLMFKPDRQPDPGEHSCKQNLPEMAALVTELRATGVLQSAIGLLPGEAGARVRLSGNRLSLTDGPFAEAKELVGGVAVVDVPSKQAAVELAERFLRIAGGGESEVRQVDEPKFPPN
jgi:hypothetical protein